MDLLPHIIAGHSDWFQHIKVDKTPDYKLV